MLPKNYMEIVEEYKFIKEQLEKAKKEAEVKNNRDLLIDYAMFIQENYEKLKLIQQIYIEIIIDIDAGDGNLQFSIDSDVYLSYCGFEISNKIDISKNELTGYSINSSCLHKIDYSVLKIFNEVKNMIQIEIDRYVTDILENIQTMKDELKKLNN